MENSLRLFPFLYLDGAIHAVAAVKRGENTSPRQAVYSTRGVILKEVKMRSSKAELPVAYEGDGVVFRETAWGAMHVEIDTFDREFDFSPLLKGFPDDMDPAPHWGYVLKGCFRFKYRDREEIFKAGDVFYAEPWHTAIVDAGTEFVMFSPEDEEQENAPVKLRNLANLLQER